ncbi:MAG: hypothetical protein HQM06_18060, partial [Magnetococcales bacterium]|nr:hypothetical protein [Magnetococcales bacterium]
MGLSMFQVKKGISIDGAIQMLFGSGAPGGSGDSASAPKGSQYFDNTNGQMYIKKTAGSGTDKWLRLQDAADMAAALQGISWRDPVKVHDGTTYANKAEAETAVNTGTVDGVAVAANDRILFDGITGFNKNVFVITGTPGSGATLTEDSNAASKGDALYVQNGTDAGKQVAFNGTNWVQQNSTSSTEIGFIKGFIGKGADGNETPDYSSNIVVTDGNSLEDAIGQLDAKVGTVAAEPVNFIASGNTLVKNLQQLDLGLMMARLFNTTSVSAGTPTACSAVDFSTKAISNCFSADWEVVVASGATDKWSATVSALFDRTAQTIDYSISNIKKLGTD